MDKPLASLTLSWLHPDSVIKERLSTPLQEQRSMENDQSEPHRCLVCIPGFADGHLSRMFCGHLFHTQCIRTSLSKKLECPSCKQLSPPVNDNMICCQRCTQERNDPDETPSHLVLSRKCYHIHTSDCQERHLRSLPTQFPLTPAAIPALMESVHPGCHSCYNNANQPSLETNFLTHTPYLPGINQYTNPTVQMPDTPPAVNANPTITRPRPLFSEVLVSGSNISPLGDRNAASRSAVFQLQIWILLYRVSDNTHPKGILI